MADCSVSQLQLVSLVSQDSILAQFDAITRVLESYRAPREAIKKLFKSAFDPIASTKSFLG